MSTTLIVNNKLSRKQLAEFRKMQAYCVECSTTQSVKWYKGYKQCSKCYDRQSRIKNKNKIANRLRIYRQLNKEKIRASKKAYRAKNRKAHVAEATLYKKRVRKACPPWVDRAALKAIYVNCPPGHSVDHIIPLTNDFICGLHVPCNLQYLSISENAQKWNQFDGTYDNNSWRNK